MPSLLQRIQHWLQDHNLFQDRTIRSARRRLRESNAVYGESKPQLAQVRGTDGRPELTSTIKPYPETVEEVFGVNNRCPACTIF